MKRSKPRRARALPAPRWHCWHFEGLEPAGPVRLMPKPRPLTVWCHKPEGWRPSSPVVFVMHGIKRNARRYRDTWIPHSERFSWLLLAPEFAQQHYPGVRTYHLGNMFSPSGQPLSEEQWTYTLIERVFEAVKAMLRFDAASYHIYGHSAGAQFVHRLLLFRPEARVKTAICANAGWYTLPTYHADFPYGLNDSGVSEEHLKQAFQKKLVILLGANDTNPHHKYLNNSPEAKAQGKTRYERGKYFYRTARREAERLGAPLHWELVRVRGIGHSNAQMAREAVKLLS
jgi:pimeloyl-ACP methyl ester carboxylesterase